MLQAIAQIWLVRPISGHCFSVRQAPEGHLKVYPNHLHTPSCKSSEAIAEELSSPHHYAESLKHWVTLGRRHSMNSSELLGQRYQRTSLYQRESSRWLRTAATFSACRWDIYLAEDGGYQLLYKAYDGILVHEGHLHIQLRELRLPARESVQRSA